MICYKDMTFCPFWASCKDHKDCGRALYPSVQAAADKFGLPTCQFVEPPKCFNPIKVDETA